MSARLAAAPTIGADPAHRAFPVALVAWGALAMALDIGIARLTYGAVLPAIRSDLDLSYTWSGVLGALNLAGYLAGTLTAPRLGHRIGMVRLTLAGHLLFAAGAAASGLAWEPWGLGLGRLLMGIGAGTGLAALLVVIFANTRTDQRSTASVAAWSGIGFAVVLTGLSAPVTLGIPAAWRAAFLVPAVLGVAVALRFLPRFQPEVPPPSPANGGGTAAPRAWWPLYAAYFMFGVGYLAYATFVGTRLAALGAPTGIVVLNWVVLGVGSILGSLAGASLLRGRRSRALTLAAALAAGLVGSLAASAAHDTAVLAAALFVGLGLAATPAIVTAYVRQRTSDGDYAMRFSHATAVLGIGQLVGPVIGGILADHFGPGAVPALAAAAYGVGSALALRDAFEDIRFGGRAQQCNQ